MKSITTASKVSQAATLRTHAEHNKKPRQQTGMSGVNRTAQAGPNERCLPASSAQKTAQKRKGSFAAAVRAETLKSRHAAPMRLAVVMALPFPLMALANAILNPQFGVSFSPWNYWYALLLAVMLTLMGACVAASDARLKLRPLLSAGAPPARAWWAKSVWCLALSLLSNLIVFAIYTMATVATGEASLAGMATMLAAALVITVASSWMIPATLFLTARFGMLAGIFIPLVVQIAGAFCWSLVPYWPAFPPTATVVAPTAFLPVLPTAEPLSAGPEVASALGLTGTNLAVAMSVAAAAFIVLTAAGAAWLSRAEER